MTPNQFRKQHGDPTTWTTAEFDSFQVVAENTQHNPDESTLRTRLTFQAHGVFRAARKTVRVIRHLRVSSTA
ncbi:hypothetical protein [Streptomyces sp900116325]|uniref:hypothetical protein n=1 Tax=Streptomyces sp. 900116325 TaxID=3154295 RepID=UPI0033A523B7